MINSFGKEFLEFIDQEINKGKTIKQIALEQGKTEDSLRSKLKRERNKFKKDILLNTVKPVKPTNITRGTNCTPKEKKRTEIIKNTTYTPDISKKAEILNFKDIENKLDKILSVLDAKQINPEEVQLIGQPIQTPSKTEYIKTSIRVDKSIWEAFKDYADSKKHTYKQQDLITTALYEFMKIHK